MREKEYQLIFFMLMGIVLLTLITFVFNVDKLEKAQDEIKQLEFKNELLQEENANLHDDIWNLNQALMKEEK